MKRGWWLVALLQVGLTWWLSGQATPLGVSLTAPWDKLAHGLSYLLLGYALTRATGRPALAWALAAWLGALDEVHQAFVPGREAGLPDWWADLIGSGLGVWLAARGLRRRAEEPDSGALTN